MCVFSWENQGRRWINWLKVQGSLEREGFKSQPLAQRSSAMGTWQSELTKSSKLWKRQVELLAWAHLRDSGEIGDCWLGSVCLMVDPSELRLPGIEASQKGGWLSMCCELKELSLWWAMWDITKDGAGSGPRRASLLTGHISEWLCRTPLKQQCQNTRRA